MNSEVLKWTMNYFSLIIRYFIDDSGSMGTIDCENFLKPNGRETGNSFFVSRWNEL